MITRNQTLMLLTVFASVVFVACNDQGFKNAAGGESIRPAESPQPQVGGFETRPEAQAGGSVNSSNSNLCANSGQLNVVLVFDASGSQSDADQQSMRTGALSLLTELKTIAARVNSFAVNVSVVSFSAQATIASNRWVDVGKASAGTESDINQATSGQSGGTIYANAIQKANELLREKGATPSKQEQRNYVVFLSDGEAKDKDAVRGSAQSLVDQTGGVFLTIGTGGSKFPELQMMSSLTTAQLPPDHRGQFTEAKDQTALSTVFRQVGDKFKALCP
jgi:uncharacterized protein YegL